MSDNQTYREIVRPFRHRASYHTRLDDYRPFPEVHISNDASQGWQTHYQALSQAWGNKNPMWRWQVRHLQNATTAFYAVMHSEDPEPFITYDMGATYIRQSDHKPVYQYTKGSQEGSTAVLAPPYADAPSSVVADVTNRCIRKFLQAVDSAQSSFEAGQDLGEWKQTVESVRHPLNSLKQSILQYTAALRKRRRLYKRDISLPKVLADTYLEFHFGWQPLVADVSSCIADIRRFRFPVIPVRASAHKDYASGEVEVFGGYLDPFNHSHSYKETSRYECRYKGLLRVKNLDPSGRLSLCQSLQLTPDKWLPTAWDLLPYSWMADYFINIGEIISGVCAAFSIDLPVGTITRRNKITRHYGEVKMLDDPYPVYEGYDRVFRVVSIRGGTCETWTKSIERNALSGSDLVPSLELTVPTSPYPFYNMAAVLTQSVSGLVPYYHK